MVPWVMTVLAITLVITDDVSLHLFVPLPPYSCAVYNDALDCAALKATLAAFPRMTLSIWKQPYWFPPVLGFLVRITLKFPTIC